MYTRLPSGIGMKILCPAWLPPACILAQIFPAVQWIYCKTVLCSELLAFAFLFVAFCWFFGDDLFGFLCLPFPTANEFSVLSLYRNGRQCRVIVPGKHWDCFRSWFQNQSKKFLGFTPEKKVQKIMVKYMCMWRFVQRLAWVAKWRKQKWERNNLKRFWSSVFKWVKGKLEVQMAF